MKKKVNINSPAVLYVFTPPLSGVFNDIELPLGDIRACLMQGAKVEEILPNGDTVRLYLDNYDKDNSVKPKVVETVVKEVKIEEPVIVPEPVDTIVEEEVISEIETQEVIEEEPVITEEINEESNITEETESEEELVKEEKPVKEKQNNYNNQRKEKRR